MWRAFWVDYALGQGIVGSVYFGLVSLTAHYGSLQLWPIPKVTAYYLVLACLYLGFLFVVSVFVWRCARNVGNLLWGYAARSIVAIEFAWFFWKYLRLVYFHTWITAT